MNERYGFVGIVVENRSAVPKVNEILSDFSQYIRGRLGLPDVEHNISIITLVVQINSDKLGAMTGQLGKLHGVRVKSALTTDASERMKEDIL